MTKILFNGYLVELRKAVGVYYPPKDKAKHYIYRPEPSFPSSKAQGGKKRRLIQLEFPTFRWTGTVPSGKRVALDEIEAGEIESSTLVTPDGSRIPGEVEEYSESEKIQVAAHYTDQEVNYVNSPQYAAVEKLARMVIENQNKMVESNLALAEETRKSNENARTLVTHAAKMEEAAREARTKPADAARDILYKLRKELTVRDNELLDILEKTGGNQVKAGKLMDPAMSQPTVYRRIDKVLRPAYAKAGMELPVFLLNREERMARKLRADVNPIKRTGAGDITQSVPDDSGDDE